MRHTRPLTPSQRDADTNFLPIVLRTNGELRTTPSSRRFWHPNLDIMMPISGQLQGPKFSDVTADVEAN